MPFGEFGFGIEEVHVTWAAVHEEEDDRARARGEMRGARGERVCGDLRCGEEALSPEKGLERQRAKTASGALKKLSSGEESHVWSL